ncbi:MAG TPA: glycosyltransferase, partial [Methylophilus sp.]
MTSSNTKKIDLIYVEGSGDIVEAMTRWYHQEDVITETSLTFSGQVFDFCKKNNLNTLGISSFPQKKQVAFTGFSAFSQRKISFNGAIGYHLSQILYGLYLIGLCLRYRPHYFHVTNGATHWFMLAPLKLLGIKIFPQFHNTFWAKGYPPTSKVKRLLLGLDGWFLKYIATRAICCSPEIKSQIETICHGKHCPTDVFKAQFYRNNFETALAPPAHDSAVFKVVFAGRVEHEKGVFDILEMAQLLKDEPVAFHICGGGSDLALLQSECKKQQLESQVTIHGRLNRPALLAIYAQAHTVIVPTRSSFCEGLPMVAIESILLGRPVITSSLSNALDVLGAAIVE